MKYALLAAASALALAVQPAAAQIKIGFISTFTGPQAAIGNDMRDSANLALEHLGGKMGGKDVQIVYEDDTFRPEVGKQKTDKLIQQDRVDIVTGFIWSNVLLASYKSVLDAGKILISANAGPSQLAGDQCHENFFSASWQNDQTPMAMGEAMNRKGIKKLYIMSPNYAAGRDMAEGVKSTFKGELVGQDLTKWPDQLDFAAELSKVRAARPDALFVFYPGAHGVQILTQYNQSGLKGTVPLYAAYTIDALSLPLQKEQALGVLGTQHWVNDLNNPANQKFVGDFRKKHGGKFPSFYGQQSYDAVMLIASAVQAVNGNAGDVAGMRAALRKANFQSTRGAFKFGSNHFPIQNFYLQETVKLADGTLSLKTVDTVFTAHQDLHAGKCPMKW
ncbi:MAG: ABC transporter substrate-binding protein [Alphaproteobacteria bacterium]|nr:ABC transporter substrate-binding protein [Alphaproteobacteria bacterium]